MDDLRDLFSCPMQRRRAQPATKFQQPIKAASAGQPHLSLLLPHRRNTYEPQLCYRRSTVATPQLHSLLQPMSMSAMRCLASASRAGSLLSRMASRCFGTRAPAARYAGNPWLWCCGSSVRRCCCRFRVRLAIRGGDRGRPSRGHPRMASHSGAPMAAIVQQLTCHTPLVTSQAYTMLTCALPQAPPCASPSWSGRWPPLPLRPPSPSWTTTCSAIR